MRNEHTVFPGYGYSASVQNMAVYSFHTYGKTGASLNVTVTGLVASVNAVHTPASSPLPVAVTEHASHTASLWSGVRLSPELYVRHLWPSHPQAAH